MRELGDIYSDDDGTLRVVTRIDEKRVSKPTFVREIITETVGRNILKKSIFTCDCMSGIGLLNMVLNACNLLEDEQEEVRNLIYKFARPPKKCEEEQKK